MTNEQAKSELMQIYMSLSEEKKQALDVLMAQADGDAISREELLKAIDTWDKFGCDADTKLVPYQDHYIPYIHYDDIIKCIKGMPSATPQIDFQELQDRYGDEVPFVVKDMLNGTDERFK